MLALRVHVLLVVAESQAPRAWVHRDVIVLPHAAPYESSSDNKAAHVSQAGRRHPPPQLLAELPGDHPAANLWPDLQRLAASVLCAGRAAVVRLVFLCRSRYPGVSSATELFPPRSVAAVRSEETGEIGSEEMSPPGSAEG